MPQERTMSVETQVPTQFQCPITLEVMKDPVTLPTGQTYERGSIQRWFRTGKKTCPTTRQELRTAELIPNLTLKNCIRGWQITAQSKVPSSLRLLTNQHVKRMLDNIRAGTDKVETLRLLRTMAKATEKNKKMIVDGGALPVLSSILSSSNSGCKIDSDLHLDLDGSQQSSVCIEEALGVMAALCANEDIKQAVGLAVGLKNLSTLSLLLRTGSLDAKMSAVMVLECLVMDDAALPEVATVDGLLPGVVGVLREDSPNMAPKAMTAGLRALYAICLPRKNRVKVVEAGAVAGLIELLPGARRSVVEGAMATLSLLSKCSQGRVALCDHALSIPLIVKVIISQSSIVTEHAVKVLHSMLLLTGNPLVHCQAMKHGIMRQLLLVIQGESEQETKQQAQEMLKFLRINCDGDLCINTIKYST
ncbi:unnamed protein product [Calypogeia fissa]